MNTGPNDPVTKDYVIVRSDYFHQLSRKASPPESSHPGAKILESLREAVRGDFARATIEGQTWIRQDVTTSSPTWEYKVVHDSALFFSEFTKHGQEGWELVSARNLQAFNGKIEYIFKREKR